MNVHLPLTEKFLEIGPAEDASKLVFHLQLNDVQKPYGKLNIAVKSEKFVK